MSSLRDIKKSIGSIKSTQKVVRAMKLVAATRLRKAQQVALAEYAYASEIHHVTKSISMKLGNDAPTLWRRRNINNLDMLVFVSDKGFCGDFNQNIVMRLKYELERHKKHGVNVTVFAIGKKTESILGPGAIYLAPAEAKNNLDKKLSDLFSKRFIEGVSDGAGLMFNRLKSSAVNELVFWDIVPLHWRGRSLARGQEVLYDPDREQALNMLAKKAIQRTIKQAILESHAAELSLRLFAMDQAVRNADRTVNDLKRKYNRKRQNVITQEIMNIVSGSENFTF